MDLWEHKIVAFVSLDTYSCVKLPRSSRKMPKLKWVFQSKYLYQTFSKTFYYDNNSFKNHSTCIIRI